MVPRQKKKVPTMVQNSVWQISRQIRSIL
jgi:hypothetical protein